MKSPMMAEATRLIPTTLLGSLAVLSEKAKIVFSLFFIRSARKKTFEFAQHSPTAAA